MSRRKGRPCLRTAVVAMLPLGIYGYLRLPGLVADGVCGLGRRMLSNPLCRLVYWCHGLRGRSSH